MRPNDPATITDSPETEITHQRAAVRRCGWGWRRLMGQMRRFLIERAIDLVVLVAPVEHDDSATVYKAARREQRRWGTQAPEKTPERGANGG
ncbi:hypothetical protein [Bradyrhizobium sp. DOA1]|uniref:hypothetical protein n=1 Tax=Bradyrhizobium sp. DOA1 TaxID=1126616 RepID=UPI000AE9E065|nr:hypothetical protein [Bradyrhizobium sp. DOA1]